MKRYPSENVPAYENVPGLVIVFLTSFGDVSCIIKLSLIIIFNKSMIDKQYLVNFIALFAYKSLKKWIYFLVEGTYEDAKKLLFVLFLLIQSDGILSRIWNINTVFIYTILQLDAFDTFRVWLTHVNLWKNVTTWSNNHCSRCECAACSLVCEVVWLLNYTHSVSYLYNNCT